VLQTRAILKFSKRGKHCLTFEGKPLPVKLQNVVAELIIDHLLAESEDGERSVYLILTKTAWFNGRMADLTFLLAGFHIV